MAFMQLAADSAFEIQFPGEQVPFTLRPGNDNSKWFYNVDMCYSMMYILGSCH